MSQTILAELEVQCFYDEARGVHVARCAAFDALSEGPTEDAAFEALQRAIGERLSRAHAEHQLPGVLRECGFSPVALDETGELPSNLVVVQDGETSGN